MKVVWNTCEEELSGRKSLNENYQESSFENFQNQLSLLYIKYVEKTVSLVHSFITSLPPVPICNEIKSWW